MALGLSKRKACALLFWGAPVLLIHLVDYCCQVWAAEHGDGPMQDLQMLELFSGEQELTRQCRLNGIECRAMDIRKDKVLHDLTSSRGFCLALLRLLRVQPNGMIWGGNPCASWVWISASTTKRRSREHGIFGDEGLEGVRVANCLAARFALLAMVAIVNGVWWSVEQPSSSCLPKCPYVAHVMTNMAPTWYLRTWMGAFNHFCSKPTALFGSWPLLEELKCRLSQAEQKSLRESSAGMYTKKRLPDGRVRVTGGKRLKESGAYTPEFGKRVAQLFKKGAVSASHLAAQRQRSLWKLEGPKGFEQPLDWKHADLPALRQFLLEEIAANRFHPQPGLPL
ncbi:unnamed protein product [Cladocopium goreaui]|uniref:Uncharacterized protein n=2 Tax=Cladocopium goreaui TaxID=2562237 RepID=A0A9P1FE46_9DINO|nr:unnamed protein product [Cladocopium goreaui]